MSFQQFMKQVDAELASICGLDSADLADFRYRDAYDDERDPREVAEEVLEYNDFPMEMLS